MNFNLFKRFNQNIELKDIFMQCFQSIRIYALRIDYDLIDYEHRNISWSFSKVKRAILIGINAWITILSILICVIWPHNDYLISIDTLDEIVHSKRNDLIAIEMIITFTLRECFYYYHLNEFIQYKSKINDFFIKLGNYDHNKISSKYRYYLIKFYQKLYCMSIIFHRIFIIGLLAINFMADFFAFYLYECGQIQLIKLILSVIFFFSNICQCIFMVGDIFYLFIIIVYGIEFFRICIKQLSEKSKNIFENSFLLSHRERKLFWYRFHSQYVYIYRETDRFNQALRYVLLYIELMSKSLVIICLLFYSHQAKMYLHNTFVTFSFILLFCLINILNFRIAHIPLYNRICWLSIHRWIARSQWSNGERKKHRNRYSLKPPLFLQTMTRNLFGFTCGRMFFISKFKYIQMFIMNFHMAIKFYKKICLSQTK